MSWRQQPRGRYLPREMTPSQKEALVDFSAYVRNARFSSYPIEEGKQIALCDAVDKYTALQPLLKTLNWHEQPQTWDIWRYTGPGSLILDPSNDMGVAYIIPINPYFGNPCVSGVPLVAGYVYALRNSPVEITPCLDYILTTPLPTTIVSPPMKGSSHGKDDSNTFLTPEGQPSDDRNTFSSTEQLVDGFNDLYSDTTMSNGDYAQAEMAVKTEPGEDWALSNTHMQQ